MILPMELGKAELKVEGEALVVKGWIVAPKVNWDYTLSLEGKDLLDFMGVLTDHRVVTYLVWKGGLRFLGILPKRALRFGLSYLWAELKNLARRGER